jgi:hypothetical protein
MRSANPRHLRNICIHSIILSLQELLLNQPINIPLDPRHIQRAPTPRHANSFRHQLTMRNPLARLQYAHNSRLGLVVPVGSDAFVRFLIFGDGLFELDLVDLNAVLGVGKGGVEGESVSGINVAAFGVFGEGPDFGAGERLQGAVEFCWC